MKKKVFANPEQNVCVIKEAVSKNEEKMTAKDWVVLLLKGAGLFAIFLFVTRVLFPTSMLTGLSNNPTIEEYDFAIFNSFDKNYETGKFIYFKGGNGQRYVKKIAAVSGDRVDMDKETGEFRVNGKVVIPANDYYNPLSKDLNEFPAIVPEGHVFVLGDNHYISFDSRYAEIGMISEDNIRGTMLILIPTSKVAKLFENDESVI